jgi:hypothetical protein
VGVDFDDRLEIYARTDELGHCSVRQVAGDQQLVLLPGWGPAWPSLSRDGRFVAVLGVDGHLQVWKLDGPRSELLIEAPREQQAPVNSVDFRADSRWLAVVVFVAVPHIIPRGRKSGVVKTDLQLSLARRLTSSRREGIRPLLFLSSASDCRPSTGIGLGGVRLGCWSQRPSVPAA